MILYDDHHGQLEPRDDYQIVRGANFGEGKDWKPDERKNLWGDLKDDVIKIKMEGRDGCVTTCDVTGVIGNWTLDHTSNGRIVIKVTS